MAQRSVVVMNVAEKKNQKNFSYEKKSKRNVSRQGDEEEELEKQENCRITKARRSVVVMNIADK